MNFISRQRTFFAALAIFGCGLFLFTVGLKPQEIVGFESRFYFFVLEMWRHGPSWYPMTYGAYYPDYPVTPTLIIYGVSKLLGGLNKLTAILPTAAAAAGTLTVTYLIGALHSWRLGLYAVFFMLLTNTFVMEARTISPDQYVGLVTALSFYLIYSAQFFQKNNRVWLLPVLYAFSFSIRGPIGLIVPAGVVCIFYLLEKDFKKFILWGGIALIILLLGSFILFGVAYRVGGMSFVHEVWRMQVSCRLHDAEISWYFYFVESLGAYALTYPLAILVAAGLLTTDLKPEQRKFLLKLVAWACVIIAGLSVPAGKKVRYILAFTPALALISGLLFVTATRQKYLLLLRKTVLIILWCCPALLFIALSIVMLKGTHADLLAQIPARALLLTFFGLTLICCAGWRKEWLIIGSAALSFMLATIYFVEPLNQALNKTRDFVLQMETQRKQKHLPLAFYHIGYDGLSVKYALNMPEEAAPLFFEKKSDLDQFNQPAFFITDAAGFAELSADSYQVIYSGQLGHDEVLVFVRKH
jgi:4-amino-4-deoxy-L-arabinose transferase-like glycosyltransferase